MTKYTITVSAVAAFLSLSALAATAGQQSDSPRGKGGSTGLSRGYSSSFFGWLAHEIVDLRHERSGGMIGHGTPGPSVGVGLPFLGLAGIWYFLRLRRHKRARQC